MRTRREEGARPRPRRSFWLVTALGASAFLPFILVFAHPSGKEPEPLVLSEGDAAALADGLRMVAPSYSGLTPGGEPFSVTADWALPDAPNPNRVLLKGVEGNVTLKDGRIGTLIASDGAFFPKIRRLRLEKGVSATTSDGWRLDPDAVNVDLAERTLASDGTIAASGPTGAITADRMEALDADDRIVKFVGNVHMVIDPPKPGTTADDTESEQDAKP